MFKAVEQASRGRAQAQLVGIWQEEDGGWAPAGGAARRAIQASAAARAALAWVSAGDAIR